MERLEVPPTGPVFKEPVPIRALRKEERWDVVAFTLAAPSGLVTATGAAGIGGGGSGILISGIGGGEGGDPRHMITDCVLT